MDALRQKHTLVKQADDERNLFIEELLLKIDGMQKKIDRSSFVLVLIDGDCMNVCYFLTRLSFGDCLTSG